MYLVHHEGVAMPGLMVRYFFGLTIILKNYIVFTIATTTLGWEYLLREVE